MDRRVKRTKEAIYNACLDLLMEKEYDKITISEVARKADIDRKTFYLHYTSIDDALTEYSESKLKELSSRLNARGFMGNPFDIKILFEELTKQMNENLELFRHIAMSETYNNFWLNLDKYVIGSLEDCYKDKVSIDEVKLHHYCEFAVSGIKAMYRNWLQGKYDESLDDLSGFFEEIFNTILKAEKSRQTNNR